MPSPDQALKGSGGKLQDKKVDLGAKLSKRRSQDFASKIQGWNDNGGGIVPKAEKVSAASKSKESPDPTAKKVDSTPRTSIAKPTDALDARENQDGNITTPQPSGQASPAETKPSLAKKAELAVNRQGWVRRKSKAQVDIKLPVDLTPELKHAGTPKKRVVSDGHWRRDRQAKEEAAQEETPGEITPKPVTIRRSVVSVGLKVPPSTQEFVEIEPSLSRTRPLKPFRSRSNSLSDGDNDNAPNFQSTGTKVYIKRRRRSKTFDGETRSKDSLTPESIFTSLSNQERRLSPTNSTTPTTPNTPEAISRPTSRDPRNERVSSTPKTTSPTDPEHRRPSSSRRRTKTPVDDENDQTRNLRTSKSYNNALPARKPAGVPAAPVTPRIYGNRIEGWLADTSDPFMEKQDTSMKPQPLNIPKRKSAKNMGPHDGAFETNQEGKNPRSGLNRQRSRTSPNLHEALNKFVEDLASVDSAPSGRASPGLKRSGAQRGSHTPAKDREGADASPSADDPEMSKILSNLMTNKYRQSSATPIRRPQRLVKKRSVTVAATETTGPFVRNQSLTRSSKPSDQGTMIPDDASAVDDDDLPPHQSSGIKRRMTKHSDLMSVLSQSRDDHPTIISSHSSRRRQTKLDPPTIGVVMNELSIEELQYQRDLRLLVDGVIPVLLQHALSDERSGTAKRVFSGAPGDPSITQPIVDMGVALERLRTLHRRIPMHEPMQLITWAETAVKIYTGYFQAWRLGFKDVVVNLAPAQPSNTAERDGHLLNSNEQGFPINGEGDRVDVTFLLKRPLVRVKHLARTFKSINQLEPSPGAGKVAVQYQDLVLDAKQRVVNENARLEDEAAADIDATRARDPRSLGPIVGVTIDPARRVRARDYFDMELYHSSGQQVVCKIELIYRDDAADRGSAGDVLFCEVSSTGRWLLFPPLPASLVTARKSDKAGELIIMIRGFLSDARQWRELMFLQPDEAQAAADWLDMLGTSPLPPRIVRKSTLKAIKAQASGGDADLSVTTKSHPVMSREPSPREIEIPIGERVKSASKVWDGSELSSVFDDRQMSSPPPSLPDTHSSVTSTLSAPSTLRKAYGNPAAEPEYFYDRRDLPRSNNNQARRPVSSYARTESEWTVSTVSTASTYSKKDYSVWMPSSEKLSDDDSADEDDRPSPPPSGKRPSLRRRTSSIPSMDLASIPKLRKASDELSTPKQRHSTHSSKQESPTGPHPGSAPAKLQKTRPSADRTGETGVEASVAPLGPTTPTSSRGLTLGVKPSLTPAFLKKNRRPSSPLKHEYEPSTDTDSFSESDLSESDDLESVTSKSSAVPEDGISTVGTLKAFHNYTQRPFVQPTSPPNASPNKTEDSVGPSESASQAPYRSIPPTNIAPARMVASIFTWSDSGSWVSLHPEACSIFVTPGLIEAFDLTQAQSVDLGTEDGGETTPSSRGVKPLVALELTPLVPLRRSTAVDISVRSPPNARSLIRTGNNIMFRSHSQDECDKLYGLINRARIDNPTYIALQNARGPQQSNWGEIMDNRNAQRTTNGGSWWQLGSRKGSTYRSTGSRPASVAATESSVGTMNSAFSALRRFSSGSRFFNIAKSTITSKDGTRSSNSESLSSGVGTPLNFDARMGTPLGMPNTKIRLYLRETPSKWRDMGSARLTVLLPPSQDALAANPRSTGNDKRVLIYGKSKGELLLDQILGETCFERVARTGIAVSVWEDAIGPIGQVAAVGGVGASRSRVYMIQLRTEREAAYTFGLVGKLRY